MLKALQNLSAKLKAIFPMAECVVLVGVYCSFREMHTESIIKLLDFLTRGRRGIDPLEKTSGLEHTCVPHHSKSTNLARKHSKCEGDGGNTNTLNCGIVAFEQRERREVPMPKPRLEPGNTARKPDSLK